MTEYIKNIRKKIGHDRLIIAGAGVIVYKQGKLLLQKRRDNLGWGLHGGCVEIGEAVEDAAKRELKEETGLVATNLELFDVFSGQDMLYTYPNNDQVYVISTIYICQEYDGDIISETDETIEMKWFDINNIPDDINPLDRRPINNFLNYIRIKSVNEIT